MEQTETKDRPLKLLFVCYANVCRSPIAEFVMKELVNQADLEDRFVIGSASTSDECIGANTHQGSRQVMDEHRIPYDFHAARQVVEDDATEWDYIVGMDSNNVRDLRDMLGDEAEGKIFKLMAFAPGAQAICTGRCSQCGACKAQANRTILHSSGEAGREEYMKRLLPKGNLPDFSIPNVPDPWFTGDFDETFDSVYAGCKGLLDQLIAQGALA